MGKRTFLLAAGLLCGAALIVFFSIRSCGGPDERYWVKKVLYDKAVQDAAAQHVTDLEIIVSQKGTIAEKDADIVEKDAKITQYVGKVSTLAAELKVLQDAEPVQPELETQPLVISLRAQVGNLTRMLSISADIINAKDGIVSDWTGKFNAQATISETWKRSYENEHRLRLVSEALNNKLTRKARAGRFYGKLTAAGLAVAGAYLIINSISK